ncbi:DUF448 domain-containing protein [Altererythrobacter aurantiacus]|uniref:DUF448 domain-containing protein n=1 Tax=Parapontixanthobacter aurantiacus TaxID=1463599 RepID=A0A844ZBG5_9SPHN|nr:DUF448 domain-containing protein [Parapontixanthobacter aurantiacus]MXO85881.1 DUF448 domain-containing protein [Parapontixanthobacter aurantiacus]
MRTPPNERLNPDIAGPDKTPAASADARPNAARVSRRHAGSEPERRCILTGATAGRSVLVRLAVSPAGLVLPDAQGKAPGRGAWISVSRAALEESLRNGKLRGGLLRAFKGGPKDIKLEIPDNLADRVEQALTRSLLDRLGLELRCGNAVLGTQRIDKAARQGKVALLLHAADASEDGRRALDQAWRVGSDEEGSGKRGRDLPLDRTALSVALGRDNVVHLALVDRQAAWRVEESLARLQNFQGATAPRGRQDGVAAPAGRDEDDLKD